jgi:hypothetical protein
MLSRTNPDLHSVIEPSREGVDVSARCSPSGAHELTDQRPASLSAGVMRVIGVKRGDARFET